MSHTSHATTCLSNIVPNWGPLFCQRGRREESGANSMFNYSHATTCLPKWLQLGICFVGSRGQGDEVSCMSNYTHATACLTTCLQLGGSVLLEGAAGREGGQLHVPHYSCNRMSSNLVATRLFALSKGPMRRGPVACPIIVTWLHVFYLGCNRAFVFSEGLRGEGSVACPTLVMQLQVSCPDCNCMSSNMVATACLLTYLQLGFLFCRRDRRGEGTVACLTLVTHLHVFPT